MFDPSAYYPITPEAVLGGASRIGVPPERVRDLANESGLNQRDPHVLVALWRVVVADAELAAEAADDRDRAATAL